MAPRKKKTLTLEQKAEILSRLSAGVSGKRLALDFEVTESTITYIKQHKDEILAALSGTLCEAKKKTLHMCEYPEMEEVLYKWFLLQRDDNRPISANILRAKAKAIFKEKYPNRDPTKFQASDGWFQRFKKRRGLRILKISGEIVSADIEAVDPFVKSFRAKVSEAGLLESQIYNADETGMFYKMLPTKTYVAAHEKSAPGRKIQRERITILFCSNSDGSHKIKPLAIGKAAKPRCFKDFENPLDYNFSKSAWMTAAIFKQWFHHSFVKQVKQFSLQHSLPAKAMLIVDNCTAHISTEPIQTEDGNIFVYYLPPNVTSLIQPMDQCPIKIIKLNYRSNLMHKIIAEKEIPLDVSLKSHSIKDAIILLNAVWLNLSESILKNAWAKLLKWGDDQFDEEDSLPLAHLAQQSGELQFEETQRDYDAAMNELQALLNQLTPNTNLTVTEIAEWNEDALDENIDFEE